jgi:hypothetical protein
MATSHGGQQDRELVAAETRHGVTGSQRSGEPGRGQSQQRVPGRVTQGVVDLLEPIQVDEEQRRLGSFPGRGGHRLLRPGEQQLAIRQAGQGVVVRLVLALQRNGGGGVHGCDGQDEHRDERGAALQRNHHDRRQRQERALGEHAVTQLAAVQLPHWHFVVQGEGLGYEGVVAEEVDGGGEDGARQVCAGVAQGIAQPGQPAGQRERERRRAPGEGVLGDVEHGAPGGPAAEQVGDERRDGLHQDRDGQPPVQEQREDECGGDGDAGFVRAPGGDHRAEFGEHEQHGDGPEGRARAAEAGPVQAPELQRENGEPAEADGCHVQGEPG